MIPILPIVAGAALVYSADKANQLDAQAMKKYAKAFQRSEEAQQLIKEKAEYANQRLVNVVKKKKSIIEISVPKFVNVYEKIQKIDLEMNTLVNEIALKNSIDKLAAVSTNVIAHKQEFSDKEYVCGMLTKGLGSMMIKDSERFVSAANKQMRAANVTYSQAESVCEVYDAIVQRADRIAKVLAGLNLLFIRSIEETDAVIKKRGYSIRNYSEYEKGTLMTCVNIACAISDIINIPVIDKNGEIVATAVEMLETGEQFLSKMNQML